METLQQLVLKLNVFGIAVEVQSEDETVLANLREDFAHFETDILSAPNLKVSLLFRTPPYDSLRPQEATVYTPRNISFHEGSVTYIDYSGKALAVFDDAAKAIQIYSTDADLLYEAAYLFLLSQLGELLDRQGYHRVHALGFSINGRGALVLLPMGGGKSTLGTYLLRHPSVKILSDDSPLIDRQGRLWCFPLRIGLLPGGEGHIPPEELRCIQRMEFGPKLLLRHEYFADRIVQSASPSFIFVGRRSLGNDCRISPISRLAALRQFLPNCVVGLGLFQGMEFMFNRSPSKMAAKFAMAFSRLRNCWALTGKASSQKLVLGRDHERNAAAIVSFIETHGAIETQGAGSS